MEFDREAADMLAESTRHYRHARAPRDVLDALASLLPGDSADTVYAEAREHDASVVWEVAALAGDLFIWVAASRKGAVWCLERGFNGYEPADNLAAWAQPVSAVHRVDVESIERGREESQIGGWHWSTRYAICFHDGTEVDLAMGNPGAERLARELLKRMS